MTLVLQKPKSKGVNYNLPDPNQMTWMSNGQTDTSGSPTSGTPQPIDYPKPYSYSQAANDVKSSGFLTPPEQIKFDPVTGLDQSYYDNLRNNAETNLKKTYFSNSDSLSNQLTNTLNKRGLIGSGIEAGNLTDLSRDFGSQMADMSSKLATQRSQNDLDLSKFNTTGAADAQKSNISNKLQFGQIGLGASGDAINTMNQYNASGFKTSLDNATNRDKNWSDEVNNILNNPNISPDNKAAAYKLLAQHVGIPLATGEGGPQGGSPGSSNVVSPEQTQFVGLPKSTPNPHTGVPSIPAGTVKNGNDGHTYLYGPNGWIKIA